MDVSTMIINFANDISNSVWELLFAVSMLFGTIKAGFAILRYNRETSTAGNYGSPEASAGKMILSLFIATLLFNIESLMDRFSHSLALGTFQYTAISYAENADFGRFADTINAVLTLAQVAGGIFFLMGLRKVSRATSDSYANGTDDTATQGFMQMILGCILAQIEVFLDLLRNSLGLNW